VSEGPNWACIAIAIDVLLLRLMEVCCGVAIDCAVVVAVQWHCAGEEPMSVHKSRQAWKMPIEFVGGRNDAQMARGSQK